MDASPVADDDLRAAIRDGLPRAIVTHVVLRELATGERVGVTRHACCVLYDGWRDEYEVRLRSGHSSAGQGWRATRSLDRVVDACLRPSGLPFAPAAARPTSRSAVLQVVVDVNPLSPEALSRLRGWLETQRDGTDRDEALYGSSVSWLLGDRIALAERSFERQFVVEAPARRAAGAHRPR